MQNRILSPDTAQLLRDEAAKLRSIADACRYNAEILTEMGQIRRADYEAGDAIKHDDRARAYEAAAAQIESELA